MDNLVVFNFESNEVRVVEINGEYWFVGKDVCQALELHNVSQALSRLDEYEKDVILNDTLGGKQDMLIINESGLYNLVLSSRKPEAKKFKKWITSEVLPKIRKTGAYIPDNLTASQTNNILEILLKQSEEQKKKLDLLLAEKSQKEEYGELITESFTGISKLLQSVLQGVALQYRETLQGLYDKQHYYTLAELSSNLFGENSYRVYCKARCNINGLYQTMTERIIPKDGMNYVFDKDTAVFAVWRLHFAALELGIIDNTANQYNEVIEELNNLLNK